MSSCRTIPVGPLVLLIVITGCGPGGGFNANNVTVTVSPTTTTIPENGKATLTATVNGLCSTCAPSIQSWDISVNGVAMGGTCDWFDTPPIGPCPDGTIQETTNTTLTVTYYAPSTPGTYDVTAGWTLLTGPTKSGTSVVTVSP
jgi:hypothetical protein